MKAIALHLALLLVLAAPVIVQGAGHAEGWQRQRRL